MGEKARVRETVSLFSNLWQLPPARYILLRLLSILTVGVLVCSALQTLRHPSSPIELSLVYYAVTLFMPSLVSTPIIYGIVRQRGSPLDLRRTTGMMQFCALILVAVGILGCILGIVLDSAAVEARIWSVGLFAAYLLLTFLISVLSEHHPARNFVAVSVFVILWTVSLAITGAFSPLVLPPLEMWPLAYMGSIIVCWLSVNYILHSVRRPFERDLGLDGIDLLRGFAHDYLVGNPTKFNDLMTQIATFQDLPLGVMVLRSSNSLVAVGVILYIHPGPFKNCGSSMLTSEVIDHVQKRFGVPAFVMHGTCTHHQNLTTREDFDRVFNVLDLLIESTQCASAVSGPQLTENESFRVWTLSVGSDVIVMTSSVNGAVDDVSLAIGKEVSDAVRRRLPDVRHVVITDAHNNLSNDAVSMMPGDRLVPLYERTIVEAVASTPRSTVGKPEAGIYRLHPESITPRAGLALGGITALAIRTSGSESVLISIDGNNMVPGFRDAVVRLLQTEGFRHVEVLTTDTHAVNAVALSRKGYAPVGQLVPDEYLNAIRTAALEARSRYQPVEIGINYGVVEGLRTFGEKGFDVLTQDVVESGQIAKRVGPAAAALAMSVTVILHLLP